jgi:class 3 adenylate cyclase/AmiR/NasT family two-component response regulator
MTPEEVRNLGHELRTPVNHLIGYSELLLEDAPSTALKAGLESIRATARKVLDLLPEILSEDGTRPDGVQGLFMLSEELRLQSSSLTAVADPSTSADLERIATAALRLGELADQLRSVPGEPPPEQQDSAPSSALTATILVVDDNPANRDVLGRRLRRLGYAVLEAEDGLEALARLASGGIDLVLLDVMMPRLDGYGVLERRRTDPASRDIPVIMISALDQLDSVVRCIELGAEDYLSTPFEPVLLKARISSSLEKKRLHDDERLLLERVREQAAELARWNAELEQRVKDGVDAAVRLRRLQRFLSPQVAQAILDGSAELLESHRREVTVLFCDLRGFTAFAETAEPEDVMSVLRELHESIGPRVFAHEGTLVHFTGDGMMVLFNDPLPCAAHAAQAAALALEMREVVGGLASRWSSRGHRLGMGVGIASGFATCGRVGFEGRYEYTAVGTVCNLAARLCAEAAAGEVLLSARANQLLDGAEPSTPAGEVWMKGLARPVEKFALRPA